MSKIKAIVFDFGGVIELYGSTDIKAEVAKLLNIPLADIREAYFKHNHLANVEGMAWEDMFIKCLSSFDVSKGREEEIRALIEEGWAKNKINTELINLFPLFRKAGLKIGILSNNGLHLRERLEKEGIAELVDEIVVSSEVKHQKPHKEIFELIFQKLNLKPEEIIFVDDTPKSLEKSEEIGYIPILFKNNEEFKLELEKLGIL